MQAIILAAGMGKRLGEFTANNTKCMVEVNGICLIDRMLNQLIQFNLSRIVIVIGYEGNNLRRYLSSKYPNFPLVFIENSVYDKTNNIYSLWLAKDLMAQEDTILLESDLIFEDSVLLEIINSQYKDCALVSKYETWMDGTMVRIDDDNNIVNFIPKNAFKYSDTAFYYKTVNIYKFSKEFIENHYLPFLEAYIRVLGENEYYEQVLRVITLIDGAGIKALPITGKHWYEIDDVQDLRIAEAIFADPEQRLKKIQNSFGGYWRYPGLLDFCYLVNPYFPSQRMIDEMKANFEPLLRDYPSGMNINSMLAAKYFGLRHDYIVVGNGAAELIKSLMNKLVGNVGIIYPTFEEYPNRLLSDNIVPFYPTNDNFSYTAEELIHFYEKNEIRNLLIVNPDNPSGNFIDRAGLEKIACWADEKGIRLIIDESFIDFADEALDTTLLHKRILKAHPSLCVMKSISKSYGVPGLRLGILASADKNLISFMRKDVGIWNINSFAEFYMQIYGKYEKDYVKSCDFLRQEREIFYKELSQIPFLKVIPSQSIYFLCEVTDLYTSHELTLKLLADYNILIKDCTLNEGFHSPKQFVRIAMRSRKENHELYQILKKFKH